MKAETPQVPNTWFATLKDSVATARTRLAEAEELLAKAECARDPGISPVELAKDLYRARRMRERVFGADLFGEPGWDLLLDLYVAKHEGRQVTTTSACIAASVPATTGLRWIGTLEKQGMVRRSHAERDSRLTVVTLTDEATDRMTDALIKMALQFPFRRLAR